MSLTIEDIETTVRHFRDLLPLIEAGEIDAEPEQVWHLAGALDALAQLLEQSKPLA